MQIVGAVPSPAQQQVPLPAQLPAFPAVVPPDSSCLPFPGHGRDACHRLAQLVRTPDIRHARAAAGDPARPADGAGTVDVGYDAVPPCDTPGAAATVGVRPFQPAPLAATTPWTSTVVQATIRPLSGGNEQLSAKRGETARFVVQLYNQSAAPVSFEHCPLLVEMLAPAGQPEVPNPTVRTPRTAADGSLRFEMHIQIPADAPAGNNGLFWELDPTGRQGPEAVSGLVVTDR